MMPRETDAKMRDTGHPSADAYADLITAATLPSSEEVGGNKATARVLLVLSKFSAARPEWGVSELGRELSMTKNMVHRALNTLVRHGWIVRSKVSTRYEIGPSAIEFARFGTANSTVSSVVDPFVERLAATTGETVSLAVRNGRNAVTVAGVRGVGVIARRVPVGRITPLHTTAAGRAILASMYPADIEEYLERPLVRVTDKTIVRAKALREHLAQVRSTGYATSIGDNVPLEIGLGIAMPLFDRDGECFASVTVAGPAPRFTEARAEEFLPAMRGVVHEINRRTALYSASEMGSEQG